MHSFALAVAKPGRTVPPYVIEILNEAAPADLTFEAESHVRWSDSRGRTVYGGWQARTDHFAVGSHWDVRSSGLTAFSGHLWKHGVAWATGSSWASQLADQFDRDPLVSSLDDYQGVYTAISVSPDGNGCVTSDPLGFGALYRAESDDVVVVSSRCALAARLVTKPGQRAPRDPEGVASIAYCLYMIGNHTGFGGVETIPPGSYLALSANEKARVRTWSARPWLPDGTERADDLAALVDRVRAELAASLRAQSEIPARVRIANLTGGRDSRLVLSLLLSEGIADRFIFNTFGAPALPDTVVATSIADRFGLNHRATTREQSNENLAYASAIAATVPVLTYEERIRHHLWLTSGLLSIWDLRSWPPNRSPAMVLTGLFGESMRTIYHGQEVPTMRKLLARVRSKGFNFDPAGILTPEGRAHYDAQMEARLLELEPDGGDPQDALDGFYLSGRLRRWFGPQHDCEPPNRVFPLYSMRAIRAAYALGGAARRSEILGFELMRASCDELATMPFSAYSWPEAAIDRLPDAERYRNPPATPKVGGLKAPTRTVNRDDQDRNADERVPILRAQLDIGREHPLFDLIDRDALLRALDGFSGLEYRARAGVQSAVSAAMWMNGAEARYEPEADSGLPTESGV